MTAQPPSLTTVMGTLLLVSVAQSLVNYYLIQPFISFFETAVMPLDISEL